MAGATSRNITPLLSGKPSNTAPLPGYTVGEQSSVKGTSGEGASSSIFLKGKPTAGKSAVAQDEVIANYQRRAEAEVARNSQSFADFAAGLTGLDCWWMERN